MMFLVRAATAGDDAEGKLNILQIIKARVVKIISLPCFFAVLVRSVGRSVGELIQFKASAKKNYFCFK